MKDVLTYPNETLREVCAVVQDDEFGASMEVFVQELWEIMEEEEGVGLAAPQIGVLKNILVYRTMGEEREELAYLINPRIVKTEGKTVNEEGCLSIPGVFAKVERFKKIIVEGQDFYGEPTLKETEAFSSVIIQHESDHLVGKLFVDRLSLIKRKLLLAKYSRQ